VIPVARVVVELSISWFAALWLSGTDLFTDGTEACKPTAKLVITRKQSRRRTLLLYKAVLEAEVGGLYKITLVL
jgi:hypothetical protein